MMEENKNRSKINSSNILSSPLSERQQMALLKKASADSEMKQNVKLDSKFLKRNTKGETSLHISAFRGDLESVRNIIDSGMDINIKDNAGWTPLHEACDSGKLEVAEYLLERGAKVNAQGLDQDLPLHDAAKKGHYQLVKLLLRFGGNPNFKNLKNKTPIEVSSCQRTINLMKRFLKPEVLSKKSFPLPILSPHSSTPSTRLSVSRKIKNKNIKSEDKTLYKRLRRTLKHKRQSISALKISNPAPKTLNTPKARKTLFKKNNSEKNKENLNEIIQSSSPPLSTSPPSPFSSSSSSPSSSSFSGSTPEKFTLETPENTPEISTKRKIFDEVKNKLYQEEIKESEEVEKFFLKQEKERTQLLFKHIKEREFLFNFAKLEAIRIYKTINSNEDIKTKELLNKMNILKKEINFRQKEEAIVLNEKQKKNFFCFFEKKNYFLQNNFHNYEIFIPIISVDENFDFE